MVGDGRVDRVKGVNYFFFLHHCYYYYKLIFSLDVVFTCKRITIIVILPAFPTTLLHAFFFAYLDVLLM